MTFDYGYQGSDHVATRVTLGSTADYQTAYAYDAFGRLIRVEQTSQPDGNAVSPKGVDFTYTPDGLPETITRYADADGDISTSGTQTVATSTYTYDPSLRRLTDLIHAQGATTLSAYTWTYDDTGRIDLFGTPEGTYDYQYDATGQLIDVSLDAGGGFTDSEHYEYDAAGNRTTTGLTGAEVTYATGDANRMTGAGNYTYAHDPEGNTTARFIDVDTDGTLSTDDTNVTEYEWDHRNRLTRVISRDTEGGVATQEVQYTYDYLNRWVAHTVDLDGDGAAASTSEYFVYDGGTPGKAEQPDVESDPGQIVLQLDETGNPTHRYLWGEAVDQILADEIVDDGGAEDVLWTLTDHQNTVRDLAVYDEVLDETSVVNHIAYDAFGNVTAETNAAVDHLFGYTGRAFDETTGLQNNLHRWYDASVGRWLSEDPIGIEGGDANLYRYVDNEPNNHTDPQGLYLKDLLDVYLEWDPKTEKCFIVFQYQWTPSWYNYLGFGPSDPPPMVYSKKPFPVVTKAGDANRETLRRMASASGDDVSGFVTLQMLGAYQSSMTEGQNNATVTAEGLAVSAAVPVVVSTVRAARARPPIAARIRLNTRKTALEAAKRAGGGATPVNHPWGEHGPHFHPGDGSGRPLNHDHFYYPKHAR